MAKYKIYGTNQPYGGKVVNINGDMFTTIGGTLEGDSKHVVVDGPAIVGTVANNNGGMNMTAPAANSNPVTATFKRGDRSPNDRTYYLPQNYKGNAGTAGRAVKQGTELHRHQNGTIMLGHDPNNMGAVVTKSAPRKARSNTPQTPPRRTMGNRNNGGSGY
tara:strand:+ start:764 stop:1246 length:483 start_codon:yes stop_codon:yes gene_type:complete